MTYAVIYNDTGNVQRAGFEPWGTIISKHATEEEAFMAFRKRNWHLFDAEYANHMGMNGAGTFDEIVLLDDNGLVVEEA